MSERARRLRLVDDALAEVTAIEAVLRTAGDRGIGEVERRKISRRFRTIAHLGAGSLEFAPVQELAALAEKVTDGTEAGAPHSGGELEVVQHATDVLSLLLRDLGHQLLGRRGANVAPAAGALRERLEHVLLADSRH